MNLHASLPERLETERLILRPAEPDDLEFLTRLHLDPEVSRYLGGDGTPRPPEKTRDWLKQTLGWYASHGVGQYLALRKSDGEPIGRAGWSTFEIERETRPGAEGPRASWGPGSAEREAWPLLEVGYTLERAAWGQGFATEAARAWYARAFEVAGLERVYSVIHPDNHGSIGVARKNGLAPDGREVWLDGRGYDLYTVDAAGWRALP